MPDLAERYPVQRPLDVLYGRYSDVIDGKLADYIPELAAVDPKQFAISLATVDGFCYDAGQVSARFTIQSVSKAVVYGLALEDWGHAEVLRRIGVEPSGDPFNSITFDEIRNRPYNPMVNADAIAAASLVKGRDFAEREARLLATFERFVGHPLEIDESVYRSESAVVGATLANGGVNPVTGERALCADHVRDVLSVMTTCGMYDYAGEWQFNVGLPAKSGVGGGIMAAQPGLLGIGVFSLLLDSSGNSVRGVKVCRDLSQQLRLHMLGHRGSARTVVRRSYRVSEVRSRRQRRAHETALLDQEGHSIAVYELQGDLSFASLENLSRRVIQDLDGAECFILHARRILWLDTVAGEMLRRLAERLRAFGHRLVICELPQPVAGSILEEVIGAEVAGDLDSTLEATENALLERLLETSLDADAGQELPLAEIDILSRFAPEELALLAPRLHAGRYHAGEPIVREGELADRLYFMTQGRAEIAVAVGGGRHRLGTIEAGNVFGELALFSGGRRTADVVALGEVRCRVLTRADLDRLGHSHPSLQIRLLTLAGQALAERLRRANAEIRALSQ